MSNLVLITPRLLPGIQVSGAWISLEPLMRRDGMGKPLWRWYVDLPDGTEHSGEDLAGWGDAEEVLASLVGFLGACGESAAYGRRMGRKGECADLFPPAVAEWADGASDELAMIGYDLEEEEEEEET